MVAVCSENHIKHTNSLCVQNVAFLNIAPGSTHEVTASPETAGGRPYSYHIDVKC